MPEHKLARVMGLSSSLPIEPQDPMAPANRRISILVMTREAESRLLGETRTTTVAQVETSSR
jgi:chemotaxis protein MotB